MSKMLAAVLHDFDHLELEEVPIPRAEGFGEVVVKITSCGICATDYKAIKGMRKNVTFPSILGHEPSGIVADVGPGVSHFKVGDQVIVQPSGSTVAYAGTAGWATRTIASMRSRQAAMVRLRSGRGPSQSI